MTTQNGRGITGSHLDTHGEVDAFYTARRKTLVAWVGCTS